jgi:hypothetical protein
MRTPPKISVEHWAWTTQTLQTNDIIQLSPGGNFTSQEITADNHSNHHHNHHQDVQEEAEEVEEEVEEGVEVEEVDYLPRLDQAYSRNTDKPQTLTSS